jgi:transposase
MEHKGIALTREQWRQYEVLSKANDGILTVATAAQILGFSERQIQRLKKKVREGGAAALIHGNVGNKSRSKSSPEQKAEILKLKRNEAYGTANFTHFTELLDEHHDIRLSKSSVRRILLSGNEKSPLTRRRFKPHRTRKRRPQQGLLLQTDATPYQWFKGDSKYYALHGAIDDATNQLTALYMTKNECLDGYFAMLGISIRNFGIPCSIYADRHTIFQSPNKSKAEIDSSSPVNDTQFGRALAELGIGLIAARSPQAKGRVERLWQTLQSRLPVEFAVRGITDVDAANIFLAKYIYAFNGTFAVEPENSDNMFRKPPDDIVLEHVLCAKTARIVDNGGVFSFKNRKYKLIGQNSRLVPPRATIQVLETQYRDIKAQYREFVLDVDVIEK